MLLGSRSPQACVEGAINLLLELLRPPRPARILGGYVRSRDVHRRSRFARWDDPGAGELADCKALAVNSRFLFPPAAAMIARPAR
jgi:hypothetical protein